MEGRIARRYATALYDLAVRRGAIERVSADVALIGDAVRSQPRLLRMLENPQLPPERRREMVTSIFGSRVDPLTMQFVRLLLDKHRIAVLENLQSDFQALADRAAGIVRARVQSAVPMDARQEELLVGQLSRITGKRVILSKSVDQALRGGAVVWIGDRVIDGSVAGYLSDVEKRLLHGPAAS